MKLTIGSKSNEWWHIIGDEIARQREEHPTIIHQWWDGLEWRAYEMPSERMYYYCDGNDFQHLVCLADHEVGDIAETFGLSGAYKFINHHVDVIKQGFESEWQKKKRKYSWTQKNFRKYFIGLTRIAQRKKRLITLHVTH